MMISDNIKHPGQKMTIYKSVISLLILLLCGVIPSLATAQTNRLPGVVEKNIIDPVLPSLPQDFIVETDIENDPKKSNKQGGIITDPIHTIQLEGGTIFSEAFYHKITNPYLHRPLSEQDIMLLKYDITKAYFDRGYILVKVIAPPQDISDGSIDLKVIEGKIEAIRYHGDTIHREIAKGLFSRVTINTVFHEDIVESALSDLNALNNIDAHLRLESGNNFGSTILNIHMKQVKEDTQTISYNNYGSSIVSRDIANIGLQKSNLLKLGETIDLNLNYGPDQLLGGSINWNSPIPTTDFFFNASYSYNDIEIGGRLASLGATGDSEIFRADISRHIIHTNHQKLSLSLGLEHREHISYLDNIIETQDKISKIRGNVSYLHRSQNGYSFLTLDILKDIGILGANNENAPLATRSHDEGAIILAPTLITEHKIIENDRITARIAGQLATGKLLSSDLFAIGGYYSVRGFEPGSETGEAGFTASLTYKRKLYSNKKIDLTLRPFVDMGVVYNRNDNAELDSHLYGGGLGVDIDIKHRSKHIGKTRLSIDAATSLGSYKSDTNQGKYLYFGIKQVF